MKITNINPVLVGKTIKTRSNQHVSNVIQVNTQNKVDSFTFLGKKVEADSLSKYDNFIKEHPGAYAPEREKYKYSLSIKAKSAKEEQNYLDAIKYKLEIAKFCKEDGLETDAFFLEEDVKKMYQELSLADQIKAVVKIAAYNEDMANSLVEGE